MHLLNKTLCYAVTLLNTPEAAEARGLHLKPGMRLPFTLREL